MITFQLLLKVAEKLFFCEKKRIWRRAFARCLNRENAWGVRALETVEKFFETVNLGEGVEEIDVDLYTVDITDLGLPENTHPDQVKAAMRKFEVSQISLDTWELLVHARLDILISYENCYIDRRSANGRTCIYIVTRGPRPRLQTSPYAGLQIA